ncbi:MULTISPECIES: hypothetical protein [unclassified Colwellia]|uniref:hypothetical protein n=1 Tax=unclassified Colwellia TaxID=196834 RepID=UPI0015F3553B|nr:MULTISPECIES: hypothetical protein [unclassified Colwellia]MBA6354332.1 hypothetical protein [Colwellia sp. BRX8-3]MBA6358401.1 hypothetical protein [Colwellia sp. BRX8-6]MBA6367897.1 hypothetical protein [Colwellia sp. BRX8-5]MBA6374967.1 hypothetical protein [Colwellia sp. BRX8-2]
MDKRKIKVTKSTDGKTTISRNTFGSGYKKESILQRTSTVIDQGCFTEEMMRLQNDAFDPVKLIADIERRILKFLEKNELPTEGTKKPVISALPFHLIRNYSHVIGAYQAGKCLEEILTCKHHLKNSDYKKGMAHALILVDAFSKFTFSTLEPTLALGQSRQEKMIGENIKLSNEQYDLCFKYFESLDRNDDDTRSLGKGEKWSKTSEYASKEFGVKINQQTIRKAYAAK